MNNPFSIKNSIIGAFTGFINGLFGSGGGTLLVPILNNILKVEEHKSHATALAVIIFLTTTSSIIYISPKAHMTLVLHVKPPSAV